MRKKRDLRAKVQVYPRIPVKDHDYLVEIADWEMKKVNDVIRDAIKRHIKAYRKRMGEI